MKLNTQQIKEDRDFNQDGEVFVDFTPANIELVVSRYSEEHSDDRVRINLRNDFNSNNDFSINEKDEIAKALFELLGIN